MLKAALYGTLGLVALKLAVGSGGSGGSEGFAAKLMGLLAWQWLVVAVGIAIVGVRRCP